MKVYDCRLVRPKCSGVYARALHPTADGYSDLISLTNARLKQRAKSLGVSLDGVNQSINSHLRHAIWSSYQDLQQREVDVELKSQDAGKIWDQIKICFPVYALFKSDRPSTDQDAEAQDPMKLAVREAIRTEEEALEQIAYKVKAKVQEIADQTVEKLREMDPELASQLTPRVSIKNWDSLFSVNLVGDEDIPINKRGSGTRRLVLLNFFRARAEKDSADKNTGLIYAIEEPETSQHPHNQIMLIKALEDLSEQPGSQVLLSTHTPVLARRFRQDSLRLITADGAEPSIYGSLDDMTSKMIAESLGVLPDHSVRAFVGVEGGNDISFLRSISRILRESGEDVPDLGKEEDAGRLIFVPLGGSSIGLWVSRLEGLNRPEFYLMDRDTPPPSPPEYDSVAEQLGEREGCTVWTTEGKELENYIHSGIIKCEYPGYSGVGHEFEDVPLLFAQAVHEASSSNMSWADVSSDPTRLEGKMSRAKRRLNREFVGKMTPELLTEIDGKNEVRMWLQEIGAALKSDGNGGPEEDN